MKGANRVSAGHLYAFAQALACSPDDFFEGYETKSVDKPSGDPLLSDQE